jgi:UDP-N-acetylmuramyl pentapeptide synthase
MSGPTGSRFDVAISDRALGETRILSALDLPMLGAHNVQNSCAAIAIADQMGFDELEIFFVRPSLFGYVRIEVIVPT